MYIIFVSMRYFWSRWINYVASAAVFLAVAVVIIIMSILTGFSEDTRKSIQGISADIAVRNPYGFTGYRTEIEKIKKLPHVIECAPEIDTLGLCRVTRLGSTYTRVCYAIGIDEELEEKIGLFNDYIHIAENEQAMEVGDDRGGVDEWGIVKGQLSEWRLIGVKRGENCDSDRRLGWTLKKENDHIVVRLYSSVEERTGSTLVAEGSGKGPGTVKFTPRNDSGLSGEVCLAGECEEDADAGNSLGLPRLSEPFVRGLREEKRIYVGAAFDEEMQVLDRLKFITLNKRDPGDWDPTDGDDINEFKQAPEDYRVAGFIRTEYYQIDADYIFMSLENMQDLKEMGGKVKTIKVKLDDYEAYYPEIKAALAEMYPPELDFEVKTWEEMHANIIRFYKLQRVVLWIILACLGVLTVFLIFAILSMMVMQKYKDIGVLKAVGATTEGVTWIFSLNGAFVGLFGGIPGAIAGILLALRIDAILKWLGVDIFPREVYYIVDKVPVLIDPVFVVTVVLAAIAASVLASIYPAMRAGLMDPVKALKYE